MKTKVNTPLAVAVLTVGGVLLTGSTIYAIWSKASVRVEVGFNGVLLESTPRACIPDTSEEL